MSRDVQKLIERAHTQAHHQHLHGAIETLRQALTLDADNAHAHALLAVCLHDQKRLHAADYEARAALALDPELTFAHYAMATVSIAQRRFKVAEDHLNAALGLEPNNPSLLRSLAHLYGLWGRPGKVLPLLEKAREMDPDDAATWAALAEHHREQRDFKQAEALARRALEIDPENSDALLTMGFLLLARNETQEAREHALIVLRNNSLHEGAIALLAAVKARQSPLLGLWWRFNSFFGGGSMTRRVVLLIGTYLTYRALVIALDDSGYEQAGGWLQLAWLGFCIYTWVGPAVFQKQLRKELEPAALSAKY
ncbi:tetratricopeptide repeat protein [Steroidobacter cummioxidans]|uniref:tetratricopeptide repeat protein n=1 Tax=Steroidobacter cummioxidans TaxID=1803913 RepID=UPI000E3123F8|nr:tetratricopeptide repeat protein [Steroidobacter cummioxidans]